MTFRFRLQRLLDLKEKREQELARQLASARRDATSEAEQRDALATLRDASAAHVAAQAAGQATVGELASLQYTVSQLTEHVDVATQRTDAAREVVEARSVELSGAVQERQVLDRLRDRREEQHRAADSQAERARMDAVALSRFAARHSGANDTQQEPT
jgi:flagellar FliJ protein